MPAESLAPRAHVAAAAVLRAAVPFASGLVFALGLGLSGMTQPAKVIGFLDVAGAWDPSLAFVMGGAVGTYFLLLRLARRGGKSRALSTASVPAEAVAPAAAAGLRGALRDRRLLGGAALFGVGWGLAGLCPGPALVSTMTGLPGALLFVAAMVAGMLAWRFAPLLWQRRAGAAGAGGSFATATDAPQECGSA